MGYPDTRDLYAPAEATDAGAVFRGLAGAPPGSLPAHLDPYRQAFEQAGTGMAVLDVDGRFLRVNAALCRLLGYGEEELLATTHQALTHPADLDEVRLGQLLPEGSGGCQREQRYLHQAGGEVWAHLTLAAVHDSTRTTCYYVAQITDISQRKQSEQALEVANHQRKAVLDAATQVSIIATDPRGLITVFNAGAERMLGYSAAEMVGRFTPERIHLASEVEERGRVLSEKFGREINGFAVFVEFARQGGHEEREWTYVRKDGSHIAVNLVVTSVRDQQGQITGYLGIAADVTRRKQAELQLRTSEQRFRTLATEAAVGVYETDAQGACLFVNDRWCQMTGYTAQESLGNGWVRAIHEEDREHVAVIWQECASWGREFSLEYRYRHRAGGVVWVIGSAVPLRNAAGQITGYLGSTVDITERREVEATLRKLNDELERLASYDVLTGLRNRRTVLAHCHEAWETCIAVDRPVSCIMIDVDHFKLVNDQHGHAAGDEVLRLVGQALAQSAGGHLCGRLGGEEFVVFCPDTNIDQAALLAEQIRVHIARRPASAGRASIAVTASLGVASRTGTATTDPSNCEALIALADQALLRAKQSGRNRVCLAGGE
jgi:diguanylate cyclase (GGDEF)-like protein/PAS domain S-box-containing protein